MFKRLTYKFLVSLMVFLLVNQNSFSEETKTSNKKVRVNKKSKEAESQPESMLPKEDETEEKSSLSELFKSLDYPELQVVPRASQRLKMEAIDEGDNWWYIHWPFYVSAISTLALSTTANGSLREDLSDVKESDAKSGISGAQTIGGLWLVGTLFYASRKSYQKSYLKVKSVSGSGKSNDLLRERLSEEALEKPAHTMKVLSYVSVITNLAAAGYVGSFLNDEGKIFASVTAALSFLPLIFDDWYVYNFKKHLEYKRNIFSPVVSFRLIEQNNEVAMEPTVNFVYAF